MKKNFLCFVAIILSVVLLGGCSNIMPLSKNIQNQAIVTVLAVDKEGENLMVTAAVQSEGGENSNGVHTIILSATEPTLARAIAHMQSFLDKTLFLGHIEFYLFGEQLCNEGFYLVSDYFEREFALRLSSNAYITEGDAAKLLIGAAKGDSDLIKRFKSLAKDSREQSLSFDFPLIRLLSYLRAQSSFIMPVLARTHSNEERNLSQADEPQQKPIVINKNDLFLNTYAAVQDGKLRCFLPASQTLAASILAGKASGATIYLGSESLHLSRIKLKRSYRMQNMALQGISLALSADAAISEGASSDYALLERQLNSMLTQLINQAIDFCLIQGCDYFNFALLAKNKNPYCAIPSIEQIGLTTLAKVQIKRK